MVGNTTTVNKSCNCTGGNITNCIYPGATTTTIGYCQTIISDNKCRNCGFVFIAQDKDTHDGFTWCPKCGSNAVSSNSYTYYFQPYYYYPTYLSYPSYPPYYVTCTSDTISGAAIYSTTGSLNISKNCEIKSS